MTRGRTDTGGRPLLDMPHAAYPELQHAGFGTMPSGSHRKSSGADEVWKQVAQLVGAQ